MSAEVPWALTIGDRVIGRAETREAAMALLDPRHAALAFVTHDVSGERWLYRTVNKGWIQFIARRPLPRPRADIDD